MAINTVSHMFPSGLLQRLAANARTSTVGERGNGRSPHNLQGLILDKLLLPAMLEGVGVCDS